MMQIAIDDNVADDLRDFAESRDAGEWDCGLGWNAEFAGFDYGQEW